MLFDEFEDEDNFGDAPVTEAGDGLVPPREMTSCTGQENIESFVLAMAQSQRMPHALIFAGPEGVGKATMAFRLARYLFKHGNTEDDSGGLFGEALPAEKPENLSVPSADPVFRQVASGGHPDLMTVERETDEKTGKVKSGVSVDSVRKVAPFMRMTASQGGWRIVIIDDADTMNRNAQNALLKILEEPPEQALLILITHRIGALIPTIRSRCRVVNIPPLSRADFAALIRKEHPSMPADDIDTLYAIAQGSAGQGLKIAEEGGLEMLDTVLSLMDNTGQPDWSAIHKLADKLARPGAESSYRAFCDVMLWTNESLLKATACQSELPAGIARLEALKIQYSLEDWIKICETLRDHFETFTRANLDKRQAVLGAFGIYQDRKAA
ncbi:MAG: DNA polymerase III subunit delta' [Rhodospirillales bacterium]|nr:DNA polymerase III subunit delta' [Rhodospirillales bacterium]